MIKINESGKIELLVDPIPPKRFQLRMNPEFYGIWKMFKEFGPARSMTNEDIFQGFMSCIIEKHPWLETLAERHQESVRGKADVFRAWWEMSGGLPSEIPSLYGSSNQVGAPIRPGRERRIIDPDDWSDFEAQLKGEQEKEEARYAAEQAAKQAAAEGSGNGTARSDGV